MEKSPATNMGFTKNLAEQSNLQHLYATQLWFRLDKQFWALILNFI